MFTQFPTASPAMDEALFDSISEGEVIALWQSIKMRGLSADQAWQAIITGIALDMAFAKTRLIKQTWN